MRKQKKYHYIYKTTNLIRNYFYIGMHSTDNLEDGYMGSGKRIRYSINKYGVENHKFEILEFLPSRLKLREREQEIINEDMLKDPLCINLVIGGQGDWDEVIRILGYSSRQEFNKEVSPFGKPGYDWIASKGGNAAKLVGAHLKAAQASRNKFPDGTFKNKKHSEETKNKMSKSQQGNQQGEKNSQFGKMWIYHLESLENKKIKKEDVIPEGWIKGRKLK